VDEVIERERVDFCQKMLLSAYILEDDMVRLEKAIADGISKEDFIKEIEAAVDRRRESEKMERLEEELAEEMSEVEEEEEEEEEEILKEIEELEDF
jgi:hypothetical protein